jgi:transposase
MLLREILTRQWWRIQDDLFAAAEEDLGPLSEKHRALIVVLETVCVERFLPYVHGLVGRPLAERTALARAFVVKAVFNLPTTRLLIDLLQGDIRLRRLCGWERVTDIPSEATFSRGFAEFAKQQLPARIHEALIKATLGQALVGHIARDGTAIEAREKPVSKPKTEKKPKKRGRRRKGEPAPILEPSRIEQQKNMTLAEMLADLPKACTFGNKRNAKGHQESWIGYKTLCSQS